MLTSKAELDDQVEKEKEKRYNNLNKNLTQKLSREEFDDLTSHDLERIKKVMASNEEIGQRLSLKETKQEQHILGSDEYNKRNNGQSYFENTNSRTLHNHMLKNMEMSDMFRRYQFVESGRIKGVHVQKNGTADKANQIKVHQGKGGLHGVPNKQKAEE